MFQSSSDSSQVPVEPTREDRLHSLSIDRNERYARLARLSSSIHLCAAFAANTGRSRWQAPIER